jgi:DNA-binding transcriptional regulator YbjK
MTNPKVSEKEMLDMYEELVERAHWDSSSPRNQEIIQAIRAAIEERGRLRKQIEKWQKEAVAIFANLATGTKKTQRKELENALMLLQELRYFKLDGEGEK